MRRLRHPEDLFLYLCEPFEPALDSVARLSVPFVGDGCAIDLFGNGQPRLRLGMFADRNGELFISGK